VFDKDGVAPAPAGATMHCQIRVVRRFRRPRMGRVKITPQITVLFLSESYLFSWRRASKVNAVTLLVIFGEC
jgi:hypothetical protein